MSDAMPLPLMASCLLFDMDGTLIDATKLIDRIWIAWSKRHGIDPLQVLSGSRGQRIVDTVRAHAPASDVAAEVDWLSRQAHDEPIGPDAMPGAAAFLAGIPGDRWAVVTSAMRPLAEHWLATAGLPCPSVLVTGDDVADGKPDPGGYLLALTRLACPPARAVVFEDAPAGIEAACRAGIRVIGIANPDIRRTPVLSHWIPDFTCLSLVHDATTQTCIVKASDAEAHPIACAQN
ncbi:MAG: HAD-IA family hydrolase [Hyphomicrobiaceae bacterium]|nr:HAD-IA family hydrolase [Hyphomicrobiaceae bacterium]